MVEQTFVGDKPVEQLSEQSKQKISDAELDKTKANRGPSEVPGANKRAGIATRDPQGTLLYRYLSEALLTFYPF